MKNTFTLGASWHCPATCEEKERGCVGESGHQPQRHSEIEQFECLHALGISGLLRLVFDTAALRGSVKMHTFTFLIALLLPGTLLADNTPQTISLWQNGAPGFESRKDIPEAAASSYSIKSINNPSLTVFLPPREKANGAAVVICPGGGFRELVFGAEGVDPARYFTNLGVAAFVLKYRLFRETNSPYTSENAREDGLRAMRLVRSRANEWSLDTRRIGMVGYSAGGEVVSLTAFGETAGVTNASDGVDRASARPDFIAEIYPGPLGVPAVLPPDVPPAFLLCADDDRSHSVVTTSLLEKYRAAKVPAELHLYAKGGHGFNQGQRSKLASIRHWPDRLTEWMEDNNILNPAVPAKGEK